MHERRVEFFAARAQREVHEPAHGETARPRAHTRYAPRGEPSAAEGPSAPCQRRPDRAPQRQSGGRGESSAVYKTS